jgi:hypothetical protein
LWNIRIGPIRLVASLFVYTTVPWLILIPRLRESYDYGNGTTEITAAMEHMTNLRMYYDHLMMFGPDGSKTPSKIRIVFPYIEGGTWVRLAIPFPSGSAFTIVAFYGSAMMTQVYSKDDLDALKYYYDGTTQLLWLHISAPDNSYTWYHGKFPVFWSILGSSINTSQA